MTRTVEQLQLSVEDDGVNDYKANAEYLIRRMAFLKPPETWVEAEERRRIFWYEHPGSDVTSSNDHRNVFLMDRFCSVATGYFPHSHDFDAIYLLTIDGTRV
jgi:hypothetical protein